MLGFVVGFVYTWVRQIVNDLEKKEKKVIPLKTHIPNQKC
jgi:hypothetical protein